MDSILEQITDWLKEMLVSGIMQNLSGMFDSVNQRVGDIATQVGTTPAAFSPGIFGMIRNVAESVIVPIAGMILTFIAGTYTQLFQNYPDVVSTLQLCEMLGVSERTVYRLLVTNQIKHFKVGRAYRIPKVNVFAFMESECRG